LKKFLIAKLVSLVLIGQAHARPKDPCSSPSAAPVEVGRLAQAIARTEGYCRVGTLPNRLNNPGDIRSTRRDAYTGQVGLYRGYVVFRSERDGWRALCNLIQRVVDGTSSIYRQEMSFKEIARHYASSPQWVKTLCKILRVSQTTTLAEYFGLAPRIPLTGETDYGTIMRTLRDAPMPSLPSLSLVFS
jgi:hypothetical protein